MVYKDFIHGEKIYLRAISPDDCNETYSGWLNDPEVIRFLEVRWQEQNMSEIKKFVNDINDSNHSYLFAIVERATGRHVGNIKIGPVNPHHLFADISYFIGDKSCWGRGYATDAVRCIVGFGFDTLGLHRIQAGAYSSNIGSCKALERAGFLQEGRERKKFLSVDGYEDHIHYGILKSEYQNTKNNVNK